ncbi:EamA family transporter [Serinibacter arcticus]|uniref:Integral membrane protein n=1 Tax=Serinibacter arcticus TaxID=1655435 RepID=A0A4Z1E7K5_9MICO|nr:EamA family transporter [Serinibacter arcticus]TGO06682.1 Integral membrane protein [Serinibacter arcticus]
MNPPGTPQQPGLARRGGSGVGAVMVLGSCLSLQVGAAFAAQLFPALGPGGTTFLRLGIAALVLLVVLRPRVRAWNRSQWLAILGLGLALAGMNSAFYASIARIPLGIAVTVEFLGPLVLAAALTRRARDGIWVLVAAAGVATLGLGHGAEGGDGGTPGGLDPLGVLLALIAAAFWAAYILANARVSARVPGMGGLAVAMLVATVAVAPFGEGAAAVVAEPQLLLMAAGTALLASVIPYSLELAALRRLPARAFSILLSLEPAVACLAGLLLLSQTLTWVQALAVAVVVGASVGSTLSARSRPVPPVPLPPG